MMDHLPRTDSERIAIIETVALRLELRLLGSDGEGGIVERLDQRISSLEQWRWWLVGLTLGSGVAGVAGMLRLIGVIR